MTKLSLAMLVVVSAALPSATRAQAADPGQAEQFTPEFQRVHTSVDPKHTPKIEAPDSVRRGQWFQVTVTVKAGTSAISKWTVKWTYANGQAITQLWSGNLSTSGSAVTVTNLAYNGTLAAGATTTFGFTGTWTGTNATPTLTCTA